jgi:serine/threonine-protein kinase
VHSNHDTDEGFVDRRGMIVDGYVLETTVAAGGLADVWEARHPERPGRYAVKIARGEIGHRVVARFEREARILLALRHPNIVPGITAGYLARTPYIIMPFVEGRTLYDLVERGGPLPVPRAEHLTLGIAAGIRAAHDALLVHRDLKPDNVIVADDPVDHPRILDFGLARAFHGNIMTTRLTKLGITGTPSFMAPEQVEDVRKVGPPADIYALGAIVCFMLLGRPPFTGTMSAILNGHVSEPPPDLRRYGRLGELANAMLAKSPEDRPRSAATIIDALSPVRTSTASSSTRRSATRAATS